MDIKQYKKEFEYSYSLGAFPTIELINNKLDMVERIYIHSTFTNLDVLNLINEKVDKNKIIYNDKVVEKLSDKGNCFVVGIYKKYKMSLDENSNHLLLDNPSNMGNLGTIIRSSLGFDFNNIAIIKPGVDIFDPKVIRSSMGALFSVNIEYLDSVDDYISKYNNHTIYSFMLQSSNDIRDEKFDKELSTLAFGNEATGLPLKYLDMNSLIIKHSNKIDSLNITNAISIALYEFSMKRRNR